MAGILGKIEKVVDAATTINSIVSKVNSSGMLSGIDLNSITPDSVKSIGSNLSSKLTGQSDSIMKELSGSVNTSEIENIASSITPEDVGIDMSQFNNIPGLDGITFN